MGSVRKTSERSFLVTEICFNEEGYGIKHFGLEKKRRNYETSTNYIHNGTVWRKLERIR